MHRCFYALYLYIMAKKIQFVNKAREECVLLVKKRRFAGLFTICSGFQGRPEKKSKYAEGESVVLC